MMMSQDFGALDIHFARLMCELSGTRSSALQITARLLSRSVAQGHVCLPLDQVIANSDGDAAPPGGWPSLDSLAAELRSLAVCGVPGEFKPLILDPRHRLYTWRYWNYERQLVRQIFARATAPVAVNEGALQAALGKLFGPVSGWDWQQFAAFTAARRNFCVISGGPGTGKTRAVVMILALLLLLAEDRDLRIALCAPTGKAATRLKESIERLKATLPLTHAQRARIPADAATVHRLLGAIPNAVHFRYHQDNPLPVDVLVVDEASMVDLALMAKLLDAVPATARVILLGDKDQLASVEAGSVLGDICNNGRPLRFPGADLDAYRRLTGVRPASSAIEIDAAGARALDGRIVELTKNYRFGAESGIYRVSRCVNAGDADAAFACLEARPDGVQREKLPRPADLRARLAAKVIEAFRPYAEAATPERALEAFDEFRILCATRHGSLGVEAMNALTESILAEAKLIRPDGRWYAGRPVMVTRNDYNVNLFNGDIGLVLPGSDGTLRAFFPSSGGVARSVAVARLPEHETAFAMTVHKSQGSEFGRVLLVLPDRDVPVLTRELLYTGLTRARTGVELWTNEQVGRLAIARRIERSSGLREALWES